MAITAAAQAFAADVEARRQRLAVVGRVEVLDTRGYPEPPMEVVKRLPPGCSIKFVPAAGFYGTQYFAIFQAWGENDPRWQKVQSGEIKREDARDIVQMFPRECPPAEMAAYVEHRWGARNIPKDPRAEADRLVAQAAKLYEQAEAENIDKVVDGSNERSAKATPHELHLRAGVGTANAQVTVAKDVGDGPKRLWTR